MPSTAAKTAPLTKSDYLQVRNGYIPAEIKTIFVLESPPASGKYFYNPGGSVNEPLFRAIMKDVLEITPTTKEDGLKEFAARGYFLVDATYKPVNKCSDKEKAATILRDSAALVEELRQYAKPGTGIVLVKANVCKLFEDKTARRGFQCPQPRHPDPIPQLRPAEQLRDRHFQSLW